MKICETWLKIARNVSLAVKFMIFLTFYGVSHFSKVFPSFFSFGRARWVSAWVPLGSAWVPSGFCLGSAWVLPGFRWVLSGFRLGSAWVPSGFRWVFPGSVWVLPGFRLGSAWVPFVLDQFSLISNHVVVFSGFLKSFAAAHPFVLLCLLFF